MFLSIESACVRTQCRHVLQLMYALFVTTLTQLWVIHVSVGQIGRDFCVGNVCSDVCLIMLCSDVVIMMLFV